MEYVQEEEDPTLVLGEEERNNNRSVLVTSFDFIGKNPGHNISLDQSARDRRNIFPSSGFYEHW